MRIWLFNALALFAPTIICASEIISAEKALGGADNLQAVLGAEYVSVERVSSSPMLTDVKWVNGQIKTSSATVIYWKWGMPLTIENGPVPLPAALVLRIKNLFRASYTSPDYKLSCGFIPYIRINPKEEKHSLEILIIGTVDDFYVYQDGIQIGCHAGDVRIIQELDALLGKTREEPSQLSPPPPPKGG